MNNKPVNTGSKIEVESLTNQTYCFYRTKSVRCWWSTRLKSWRSLMRATHTNSRSGSFNSNPENRLASLLFTQIFLKETSPRKNSKYIMLQISLYELFILKITILKHKKHSSLLNENLGEVCIFSGLGVHIWKKLANSRKLQ